MALMVSWCAVKFAGGSLAVVFPEANVGVLVHACFTGVELP